MPLRADGFSLRRSGLLARGSPPQPAFPSRRLSGVVLAEAPRSQLRDSSGFAPDSLGTRWNLNSPPRHAGIEPFGLTWLSRPQADGTIRAQLVVLDG